MEIQVIKNDGTIEPWDKDKLILALLNTNVDSFYVLNDKEVKVLAGCIKIFIERELEEMEMNIVTSTFIGHVVTLFLETFYPKIHKEFMNHYLEKKD